MHSTEPVSSGILAIRSSMWPQTTEYAPICSKSCSPQLGAFGFLASSILQAGQGIPNAGFWDQRAALEWTRTYIHLLNGNPNT